MTHPTASRMRRALAALALASTLAAIPAPPAYADDAANLAEDIATEQAVSDEAQDSIDALIEDPSSEHIDAAISALSPAQAAPEYSFDDIDSGAAAQYRYAQLQLQLAGHQRQSAQQKLEEAKANGQHEDIDQDLLTIQDYLKQYDFYLQSAQSAMSSAHETLQAAARGTVDDGDSASSTIDQLIALSGSIDEKRAALYERIQELSEPADGELDGSELAELQQTIEQYHNYQEQSALIMQQTTDTLKAAARGTTEGTGGDAFGIALVGIGIGAAVGAGACFIALRRRPSAPREAA